MSGLVGSVDRDIKIARLLGCKGRKLDVKLSKMGAGNLLIKLLGQHMNTKREITGPGPESNLGEDLVGEGARHHEGRMTSSASMGSRSVLSLRHAELSLALTPSSQDGLRQGG